VTADIMGRFDPLPNDALVGVHILVIDDDEDARELMRTVLSYCGALVNVARSARDGLTAIQQLLPDVIVCDIAMPHHDGYWFVQSLRGLPAAEGGALPVVAITAYGQVHGPDRTLPAGFQAHVRKPIDPWELCSILVGLTRRS
jgi:CheY-like chemotaxis protein